MISSIVSVCKPSHGINVSPLQGDIKHCSDVMHVELSDPHNWPDLLNGYLSWTEF